MLHDQSRDAAFVIQNTALPTGQRLRPVKVIDPDYERYCNELLNGVWKYRAPHANRPTSPRKKWAWGMELAPA